ncbi:MAG: hypothetical protein ACYDBQ_01090 [Thermoplasmatota archaeon]
MSRLACVALALALLGPWPAAGQALLPVLSISKPGTGVAVEGVNLPHFRVTRSSLGPPNANVACAGTAEGSDYGSPPPTAVSFAGSSLTVDFFVNVTGNGLAEGTESVTCSLASTPGYTLGTLQRAREYVVSRARPAWSVTPGPSVSPGNATYFTVTRLHSEAETTILLPHWSVTPSGAGGGAPRYQVHPGVILSSTPAPFTANLTVVPTGAAGPAIVNLTGVDVWSWHEEALAATASRPTLVARGLGNATWLAGTGGGVWRSLGPGNWSFTRLTNEDAVDLWTQDANTSTILYSDSLYTLHDGTWSNCVLGLPAVALDSGAGYTYSGGGWVAGLSGTTLGFVHQKSCGSTDVTCGGPTVAAGAKVVAFAGDLWGGHVLVWDPTGTYTSYTSTTASPCAFTPDFSGPTATNYDVFQPTTVGSCGFTGPPAAPPPPGPSAYVMVADVLRCFSPTATSPPAWRVVADFSPSNSTALAGGYSGLGCTALSGGDNAPFENRSQAVLAPGYEPGLVLNCNGTAISLELSPSPAVTYTDWTGATPGPGHLACGAARSPLPQHVQECVAITGASSVNRSLAFIPAHETVTIAPNAPNVTVKGLFDGRGQPVGGPWGNWTAIPGLENVSSDYLVASNTGRADGALTVSFSDPSFLGPQGGAVPIAGNLLFCSGTTSGAGVPATSCHAPPAGSRGATFAVPAGESLWVTYVVERVPDALPDGSYQAAFTAAPT